MKLASGDDWDNYALVVNDDFDFIKVVEIGDWDIVGTKIVSVHTTNPFKPRETAIIYPYEDIVEDFAVAISLLYNFFPEIKDCPTVFHEDTIIEKIKHYEGFAETFGKYSAEQLVFKYRAISKSGKIVVTENTRSWWRKPVKFNF